MKAVIMCGGKGSRLRPMTESVPKPLIKMFGRPVIDILVEKLINSGIENICLSLGYMADELQEYCETSKYRNYLSFAIETKPLGTAGGVRNCINKSDEDILVLSGDNIFDFDLYAISDFHNNTDADITVCGIKSSDPREYGVIMYDDDYSITSFVEKPDWEHANGFLVNTGIYIIKGSVLDLIPEGKLYDFANDLFPEIFKRNMRLMCYTADGYWGDMGEFSSYKRIIKDIFDGRFKDELIKGEIITEDRQTKDFALIKAPCYIDKTVKLGNNCTIGPYAVIEKDCVIDDDCIIDRSVIGECSHISYNSEIRNAILGDCVNVEDNCYIDEEAVIGNNCSIGRFSRIFRETRIWPGKSISAETVVSGDVSYESLSSLSFDVYGISGKLNSSITINDIARLGQAIASIKKIIKIGVGCDNLNASQIYKDVLISAVRSCGKDAYDFGEMIRSQSYFYSVYCSLDFFVYLTTEDDILKLYFTGKNAMPVSRKTAREINNNFKYSSFDFAKNGEYKDKYNMKLFSAVYLSYLKRILGDKIETEKGIYFETDNQILKELLSELPLFNEKENAVQLLINRDGTDLYLVENEKFYSYQRIMVLLAEIAAAEGKDIVVPEDAPEVIEEIAKKYSVKVNRIYENSEDYSIEKSIMIENLWSFDPITAVIRMLNIMLSTGMTLSQLFEFCDDFVLRKDVIDFDGEPSRIRDLLKKISESKEENDVYYHIIRRNGTIRLRQMGNSAKIRVIVDALDMESAKELSVFAAEKIKNANIDKG